MVNAVHLKHALGQRSGLIKNHNFRLGQGFQIVGTLHQHARVACAADACEETQRNADHQRAGTADYQEGERPVNPGAPVRGKPEGSHAYKRRQDRQRQGCIADGGGIDAGEFGYEILRPGFPGAGVLHQIQDFGNGGFPELFRGPNLQHSGHVDAAADDLVSLLRIPWQALPGEGTGVKR